MLNGISHIIYTQDKIKIRLHNYGYTINIFIKRSSKHPYKKCPVRKSLHNPE